MICPEYKRFELGELCAAEFDVHVAHCPECKKMLAADAELLAAAQLLKEPVEAPLLWDKIENRLRAEKPRFEFPKAWRYVLRIAAVLVLILGSIWLLLPEREMTPSGLLVNSTLERVETQEKQYEQSISELEAVARPKLRELDLELQLLYRDKLETIDNQISRCKKAMGENPANAHIRRYLFAALQDKKCTLREVVLWQEAGK